MTLSVVGNEILPSLTCSAIFAGESSAFTMPTLVFFSTGSPVTLPPVARRIPGFGEDIVRLSCFGLVSSHATAATPDCVKLLSWEILLLLASSALAVGGHQSLVIGSIFVLLIMITAALMHFICTCRKRHIFCGCCS